MPDDVPIITVAKVLPRGAVQLTPEVREKLGLKPGTKLILAATEDAVIIRRAKVLLEKPRAPDVMSRLRRMSSKMSLRDLEEE